MNRINVIITIILVLTVLTGLSSATPLKVLVTGTVTSTKTTGDFVFEDIGTQMTGYCTYDPETADDEDGSSYYGKYNIDSLSMSIGDYIFADNPATTPSPEFEIWVTDMCYRVRSADGMVYINNIPQSYDNANVTLFDLGNFSTGGPDDELPTSFPDISFFSGRNRFEVYYSDLDISFNVTGVIDSITVIPEPSTMCLLGLGGLLLRRRRQLN